MGCLFCPNTKAGHGVVVVKVVVVGLVVVAVEVVVVVVVVVAVEVVVVVSLVGSVLVLVVVKVVVVVSIVGSVLALVVVKVTLVVVVVVVVAVDVHFLLPDELYQEDCEGCQEGKNLKSHLLQSQLKWVHLGLYFLHFILANVR